MHLSPIPAFGEFAFSEISPFGGVSPSRFEIGMADLIPRHYSQIVKER